MSDIKIGKITLGVCQTNTYFIYREGSSDIIVFDPEEKWTLQDNNVHSASHYTPYRGMAVNGKVVTTILRGKIILDNGQYLAKPRDGKFIKQK